jgi:uncharacterized membrane protein
VHRNFVVVGSSRALHEVAQALEPVAEIITIALDESAGVKPRGGVLEIQALNRSSDEVLRRLRPYAELGEVVIRIGAAGSIIDVQRQRIIDEDADIMLWEEMEQNLRNEGRISFNSVTLMALGGAIAAAAVAAPPLLRVFGLLASSIIAPAFAPIAGIPLGVVLRRFGVVRRASVAACTGYAVAAAAAALTFLLLRAMGNSGTRRISPEVVELLGLDSVMVVISVAAAIAGALMIVSLRDVYVIGSLVALALVPAIAAAACAAVTGEWSIVLKALALVVLDGALVILCGGAVFWLEQARVHRRRPIA